LEPQPNPIDIDVEFMGVHIKTNILTDSSLDPVIVNITSNPNFNNYKGQNSETALAEFIAQSIYKASRSQLTFEEYMGVWSSAQKTGNVDDWNRVKLSGVTYNNVQDGIGYENGQLTGDFLPNYSGPVVAGYQSFDELDIAFVNAPKMDNVTLFKENAYGIGFGTNLDGTKLTVYIPVGKGSDLSKRAGNLVELMSCIPWWLQVNQGQTFSGYQGSIDRDLFKLLTTKVANNSYKAAIKVTPPSAPDKIYNP